MALEADVKRMAETSPFNALPREALPIIAFASERFALKAGETLFRQGEPGDAAFLLLEGEIELTAGGQTRRVGPGALISETALFTRVERSADARAIRKAELLKVPRATFRRVLSEYPDVAMKLRERAAGRAKALLEALEEVRARRFDVTPR